MGKRILVCDNAAFIRTIIRNHLTKNGYEIAGEAANGLEAIEKANELRPDLVLLDMYLKETDGIEVLKEIRKDQSIKVIMISPQAPMDGITAEELVDHNAGDLARAKSGFVNMKMEAVMSGACGFLEKPFKPEILLEEVKKAIG